MHEFTLGGAWFRWRTFDTASRTLAGAGMGLGAIAGLLLGMAAKPVNPRFGFDVTNYTYMLTALGLIASVLAAWLWYRFSLRQDEMFNRVQNWTLGMAGAWTCVACAIWAALATGFSVPSMPAAAPAMMFAGTSLIFWFVAVRKWAY